MNLQSLFLREKSFEGYDDNAVLECLLTTAGVRADIPTLIANLRDEFGSFKGILEAKPVQLMKVSGVTKKTAALIAMIAPLAKVWERTCMQNPERIGNSREAEAYCKSLLMGERTERFYVIALNAQCKVLGARKISEGSLSEVSAYPRMVAETALNYNEPVELTVTAHDGTTKNTYTVVKAVPEKIDKGFNLGSVENLFNLNTTNLGLPGYDKNACISMAAAGTPLFCPRLFSS